MSIALYRNNRRGLNDRDPRGYNGIPFVIEGLVDRPWASKAVIGKVRRLPYSGED